MANTPKNFYLDTIIGNGLTTIVTVSDEESLTNLWLVVFSLKSSDSTISVFHNNGLQDIKIVEKVLQPKIPIVITELTGIKMVSGQSIKIQGSDISDEYNVDFSGLSVTE